MSSHNKHHPTEATCLYCRTEVLEKELEAAYKELAFLPPKGKSLRDVCKFCQTVNWWTNLTEMLSFGKIVKICPLCLERRRELDEADTTFDGSVHIKVKKPSAKAEPKEMTKEEFMASLSAMEGEERAALIKALQLGE